MLKEKKKESRITLTFSVWIPGKMSLLWTEVGKIMDRACMRYECREKEEFACRQRSLKFDSTILSSLFPPKLILIASWCPGYTIPQRKITHERSFALN